ncbi:MAG: 4-hydroxy-tetrahydrodipicolinate reductase [bacterium]
MADQVRVVVNGVMGRMGMQIARLLYQDPTFVVVGGIERKNHPSVGVDIGTFVKGEKSNIKVLDEPEDMQTRPDCIIDFSTPASTIGIINYAKREHVSMVIGTTGFSKNEMEAINQCGGDIPIVISPNMSVLVNVVFKVVELVAKTIGDSFDAEVLEIHHRNKMDAPSGTAIKLAEIISRAYDKPFNDSVRYERHGQIGIRPRGEIGVQSLRGGDVVGEHTVMFVGAGERIEITHRATSRENFAHGALLAAKWVVKQKPGIYSMADVLGLK